MNGFVEFFEMIDETDMSTMYRALVTNITDTFEQTYEVDDGLKQELNRVPRPHSSILNFGRIKKEFYWVTSLSERKGCVSEDFCWYLILEKGHISALRSEL